mmetsp:Transcript_14847/g.42583  ORF Transcript_14847/g.42583 Transcript_14847/m.42583 type:complete len:226 (-) Transcript_14847:455-1132(-)
MDRGTPAPRPLRSARSTNSLYLSHHSAGSCPPAPASAVSTSSKRRLSCCASSTVPVLEPQARSSPSSPAARTCARSRGASQSRAEQDATAPTAMRKAGMPSPSAWTKSASTSGRGLACGASRRSSVSSISGTAAPSPAAIGLSRPCLGALLSEHKARSRSWAAWEGSKLQVLRARSRMPLGPSARSPVASCLRARTASRGQDGCSFAAFCRSVREAVADSGDGCD